MIDLSAASTDLEHICQESRVAPRSKAEAIPRAQLAKSGRARVPLHGGDDYELLFYLAGGASRAGCRGAGDADRPNREIRRMRLIGADGKSTRLKAEVGTFQGRFVICFQRRGFRDRRSLKPWNYETLKPAFHVTFVTCR